MNCGEDAGGEFTKPPLSQLSYASEARAVRRVGRLGPIAVELKRFELSTICLQSRHSPIELQSRETGIPTRTPPVGVGDQGASG